MSWSHRKSARDRLTSNIGTCGVLIMYAEVSMWLVIKWHFPSMNFYQVVRKHDTLRISRAELLIVANVQRKPSSQQAYVPLLQTRLLSTVSPRLFYHHSISITHAKVSHRRDVLKRHIVRCPSRGEQPIPEDLCARRGRHRHSCSRVSL